MTFTVIEGGKETPVARGGAALVDMSRLAPEEVARFAVVDRVAASIWAVENAEDPGVIDWQGYVRRAYAEADKTPGILADVSRRYRVARAAVAALRPPEPDYDEAIAARAYADFPCTVLEMVAMTQYVTRWIDEVLS